MSLEIEYYPLSEIEGWPGNPKAHDVPFIEKSIDKHGFNDPLARDSSGVLVEGHGRTKALRRMKDRGKPAPEHVQIESGTWLVPVLTLDFQSDEHREAYMIAHNKSTEKGGWDDETLAEVLARQKAERPDASDTGFGEEEMEGLIERFSPQEGEDEIPESFDEKDEDVEIEYRCPKCSYEWSGEPK